MASDILRAQKQHDELNDLLNPPELSHASRSVFTGTTQDSALLEQFARRKFVYHTLSAKDITSELELAATECGWKTSTELKVHVAIPEQVLERREATFVPWVRFHGGGGVSVISLQCSGYNSLLTDNWLPSDGGLASAS